MIQNTFDINYLFAIFDIILVIAGIFVATISIRNLPEEVHRALRVRAANHGRSTETEVRNILEQAVISDRRIALGSLLVEIGKEAEIDETDLSHFERDQSPGKAADYE